MTDPVDQTIHWYPDRKAGGIDGWYWPAIDRQAFDVIKDDWEKAHRASIEELIVKYGKQFDSVVQAGGNCGMYPKLLASMFKNVHTFEPDDLNFQTLIMNVKDTPNVKPHKAALGDKDTYITMNYPTWSNIGMHRVGEVDVDDQRIHQTRLDDWSFDKIDLLWLDIEGYEIFALKGAVETIRKHQPLIILELPPSAVCIFLRELGYVAVATSATDTVFYLEDA